MLHISDWYLIFTNLILGRPVLAYLPQYNKRFRRILRNWPGVLDPYERGRLTKHQWNS